MNALVDEVKKAIENLEIERIEELVRQSLEEGIDPVEVIRSGIGAGLESVGRKFEAGEYFLSELILAGHAASEAMTMLEKKLVTPDEGKKGKVALATVKGDIHEIGKNIVGMLLRGNGFEVIDLGVDVAPDKILRVIEEKGVELIGLSLLLSSVVDNLKETMDAIRRSTHGERVKVVIGGPCTSEIMRLEMGADAYAEDAVLGVKIFEKLAGITH